MTGRCTFPKCNAEVKVYKNDHGFYVSKLHSYQASPQWSQFMHNRSGGAGPVGLSKNNEGARSLAKDRSHPGSSLEKTHPQRGLN